MEDDRIEITVADDVRWSNGDQMLGRDVLMGPIERRLSAAAMPFEDVGERGPAMPWDAITDYEYDGRQAVLHSDEGYFGELIEQNIWLYFFIKHGPRYPTTLDPWKPYADLSDALETDDVDLVDFHAVSPVLMAAIFEHGVLLVGEEVHAAGRRRQLTATGSERQSPRERFDAALDSIDDHLGDGNGGVPATADKANDG